MRRMLVLSCVGALLLSVAPVAFAADDEDRGRGGGQLKVWEGVLEPEQVQVLREAGIDVAAQQTVDDGEQVEVEVVATGRELAEVRREGVKLTPKRNAEGETFAQSQESQQAQEEGVFKPYDGPNGLEAGILQVAEDHPDLVKLVDIGDTLQGRDIWALKVSKNAQLRPDGQRPAVLYSAAQHAREWITPEMNRRLLHHYLDNYGSDPEITRLVDRNELWFVLVANPDGYQYTHDEERLWRKNLRDNNGNGEIDGNDGVDLNRNFEYTWGYDNEGSSPDPFSQTYRGEAPSSEPETQALDGLLERVGFAFQVNYHSAAELLLYGTGWQVATPTPDDVVYEALAGTDAEPAIPDYDPDISAELYTTNGETTNHAHAMYDTLAFTPEMATCQTASARDPDDEWEPEDCVSVFTFPDDEALIQQEFENNLPFALDVAKSASNPDEPVSHLGNDVPDFVVDTFEVSYGSPQTVQVVADRDLGKARMYYRINDGRRQRSSTSEWDGGERYGEDFDVYHRYLRGQVEDAEPGDTVEVWFEANGRSSEPFTYEVADDVGGDVLVVADTNYTGALSGGATELRYEEYYTQAIEANGQTWDLYDVDAHGEAPHPLGVLDHYERVVWYTGDNLVTRNAAGQGIKLGHDMNIAMRDYLNEGGDVAHSGKYAGVEEFLAQPYGEDGNPDEPCTSGDCLLLSNDFYQYYLGAFEQSNGGGLDSEGEALPVEGVDTPYDGLTWDLDGGDSADNQAEAEIIAPTSAWVPTSNILPEDEFPQFASFRSTRWQGEGAAPYEPLTGDWYAASQQASISYKRLTRTVDLTGASSGTLEFATSYTTESNWDFMFVEAHTVGEDDWTTLPDANGHTGQATGESCPSGWHELHPHLEHYQTVTGAESCDPTGTTGEWHATSGTSDGWETWSIDLSAYAGERVEVSIAYVSDWAVQGLGTFVDDTRVLVDGAPVAETSFEDDLGGWTVSGAAEGSADNPNDWIRSQTLFELGATVTADDSVVHGFGFEGISTADQRTAVMGRTLAYLDE